MLFNSYVFALVFLPTTLLVFFVLGGRGRKTAAITWLVVASFFFYGWWDAKYLGLIGLSVAANFLFGVRLCLARSERVKSLWLVCGVVANLALLGYFKYANFFVDNVNSLLHGKLEFDRVVLPLAISFFTFQQIAYLVDVRRGATHERSFVHYCLFVVFFPQLIAGPILHHREMLPQFAKKHAFSPGARHLSIGITIFALGLFKKVVIADGLALDATPAFDAVTRGERLSAIEAWTGTLAYTFQLYFDFSGYSDMAIGLARMFGIRLPLNFDAPYRASSIIEFWRCWHMTLSRFLRDYLYVPLGGSRKGSVRRYLNVMVTMLLGGLWHGAGWNFVVWGGLHGVYLVINRLWRSLAPSWATLGGAGRPVSWFLTFLCVVVAWVPFRAPNMDAALSMWRAMSVLLSMVLVLPTTREYLGRYRPALGVGSPGSRRRLVFSWRPTLPHGIFIVGLLITSLAMLERPSEFLYFRF
jgi:D-alanyl-lipoteichoic acid acyltransferase DltB (MBOAT superfamily)